MGLLVVMKLLVAFCFLFFVLGYVFAQLPANFTFPHVQISVNDSQSTGKVSQGASQNQSTGLLESKSAISGYQDQFGVGGLWTQLSNGHYSYQTDPFQCALPEKVLCLGESDPCEELLQRQLTYNVPACPGYRDAMCIRYQCSKSLLINGKEHNNLQCQPLFYVIDPLTSSQILVECGKQNPVPNCEMGCELDDLSGRKAVCCGQTTFANNCLAQCEGGYSNPEQQCQYGQCSQNSESVPQCISNCFIEDMENSTPYCCDGVQYEGRCSAGCWMNNIDDCQVGKCEDVEARQPGEQLQVQFYDRNGLVEQEMKSINSQVLIEQLAKFSVNSEKEKSNG
eukprot:TRINITY_DN6202_c1_g1_i1.p2 TRINITY_DN6202_c1_g1~~TRINITY_DN6202_c1_g1_i1.p2  ORF type:complete len:338 (-),score=11.23 TRINITY_DN6202_c1_g1_i1:918-1931(-)